MGKNLFYRAYILYKQPLIYQYAYHLNVKSPLSIPKVDQNSFAFLVSSPWTTLDFLGMLLIGNVWLFGFSLLRIVVFICGETTYILVLKKLLV